MQIFRSLEQVPPHFGPSALTIGNFDGVHAGHRRILRRVRAIATARGWKPSVLTFDPHPAKVVAPGRAPLLMTVPEQRCALMQQEGIEQVLILRFDQNTAHLAPEDFVKQILVDKLGARAVVVGENFRFGHRAAGNTQLLMELGRRYGFLTEVVPAVSMRGQRVSSSGLRRLIQAGEVARAARLLERPFALEGPVIPGHGVGSKQTVPTLNLHTRCEVLPKTGVYVTHTEDCDEGRSWPSVTNVGYRPTFDGQDLNVETFLLTPLEGSAPKQIRVEFLRRLRDERKFDSPLELKTQIMRDVSRSQAYFRRCRKWTRCGSESDVSAHSMA